MRILFVHNHYRQYGGEDSVVKAESELLKEHGEEVVLYERNNAEIEKYALFEKAQHSLHLNFSDRSYHDLKQILKSFKPDICHVYNTFFMITSAVYHACKEAHVPVVQSLYNYRLICANALFLRDGRRCEDCLTLPKWRSAVFGCYKGSKVSTALIVKMINQQWKDKIWTNFVDGYITATEYTRQKHIQAGIPGERITVKPHFMEDRSEIKNQDDGHVLFIGRISMEKGVLLLLDAWKHLTDIPLVLIGEGPLLETVRLRVQKEQLNIKVLGYCSNENYYHYLRKAKFVLVPSISHDNFPKTIVEAYSFGVPVLASALDGMKEFIHDNRTGGVFEAGNAQALIQKVKEMFQSKEISVMGRNARREYEEKYTPDANYLSLKAIYEKARQTHQQKNLAGVL